MVGFRPVWARPRSVWRWCARRRAAAPTDCSTIQTPRPSWRRHQGPSRSSSAPLLQEPVTWPPRVRPSGPTQSREPGFRRLPARRDRWRHPPGGAAGRRAGHTRPPLAMAGRRCLYELDLMGCAAGGATRAWSAATRHRVEPSYRGQPYRGMVPPMKVDKLSVSFDPDLGDAVRAAARHSGGGVSRWLADAAAAKLRAEALSDFLDAWEAEHGSLTSAELSKAATELALPKPASTEPAA